ncbi:S-layer family protein [Acaryochloris sp. IP29b_bin.148]|uniref:beta strand repeat-containing protein n=1 Tax=Acaryochloris sp. IP29b_bin.148 TaxID=2969218 RepID=UPI00261530E7|nr:S-layer family protein [Acaryochloris sp. IP29b_bin.148]
MTFYALIFNCIILHQADAQIVPDATLESEESTVQSNVNINGTLSTLIQGGALRESSLFHSFREFNTASGEAAYFQSSPGISLILSRVTGGVKSHLFGKIGVLGDADLIFLNPSGILFGPTSSLDLKGSFLATTAEAVLFNEGYHFNASNPKPVPLLKISIPSGIQFGSQAKPIVNQSTALDLAGFLTGLQVDPGKSFVAIGGDINIQGGIISAPGGNIVLGSVGPSSTVDIKSTSQPWKFSFQAVKVFQDININQISQVGTRPQSGGSIRFHGKNLAVSDGSQVLASDASLDLNFTEDLVVQGFTEFPNPLGGVFRLRSTIGNFTLGQEKGGTTTISAKNLLLQNTGRIITSSTNLINPVTGQTLLSEGVGGDLIVNAGERVEIWNTESGLFSNTVSLGGAGSIQVYTPELRIYDGGSISVSSDGQGVSTGPGGIIQARVPKSIVITGVSDETGKSSGLFSTSGVGARGVGGRIEVTTESLTLSQGAVISASTQSNVRGGDISVNGQSLALKSGGQILTSTSGAGDAGNIKLSVGNRIELSGSDPTYITRFNQFDDSQIARLELDSISPLSGIFASAEAGSTGNGGSINIDPRTVIIRDGAGIFVDSNGSGVGGNIFLQSGNLILNNGAISATSTTAQGGNIELDINNLLLLRNNSLISTTAGGDATGGNIDIDTSLLVALPQDNSDITANALNGSGGKITITTKGIFGLAVRDRLTNFSDITAFSQNNPQLNGVVEINTPEVDPSDNLSEQPGVVEPPSEIAQGCKAEVASSSFVYQGRGGLPQNPAASIAGDAIWQDLRPLQARLSDRRLGQASSQSTAGVALASTVERVEAKGWQRLPNGKVRLVAQAVNHSGQSPVASC